MKIAVIGSRTFDNYKLLCEILKTEDSIIEIISGGARGADSLAKKYAKENNIKLIEFIPDWDTFGKSAGFRRNIDIVTRANKIIAFWDGVSKGTKHSINLAKKQNKEIKIVRF